MREISAEKLAEILYKNPDFVLESYVLTENKLCVKPVYKFIKAFVFNNNKFCMIYCEADGPEEIFISYNSKKFNKILREYKNCKIIFHGQNGDFELTESFYYDKKIKKYIDSDLNFRLLTQADKILCELFDKNGDCYLNKIFYDFIENKIYFDCGIIGAFDKNNNFIGYIAYYEIAENIRDVSYIYVGEKERGKKYGRDLLNFFVNKNIDENKISYYSYAADEISEKLAKSCGFFSCAKRFET